MADVFRILSQSLGSSARRQQELIAANAFNNQYRMAILNNLNNINPYYQQQVESLGQLMGVYPGGSSSDHLGMVKEFRKKFKQYTKTEFRELSKEPMIKDILSGMTKLNKDQIKERIAEHLEVAV